MGRSQRVLCHRSQSRLRSARKIGQAITHPVLRVAETSGYIMGQYLTALLTRRAWSHQHRIGSRQTNVYSIYGGFVIHCTGSIVLSAIC